MAFEPRHVASASEALPHLAEDGVVVIDGVLAADEVARLRELLETEIERDRKAGTLFNDPDDCNERLLNITARHQAFRDLVEHPLSTAIASNWLKPEYRLSSFGANVAVPGCSSRFLHSDQSYVPSPWPDYPLALNLIWALDDFTVERGATHMLPGSHRKSRGPVAGETVEGTVPMLCDAGSVILMDGRVWHHTGQNVTANERRAALLLYFVNWFLIPQTDWASLFGPEEREELSPRMLELLGFGANAAMRLEQFEGT